MCLHKKVCQKASNEEAMKKGKGLLVIPHNDTHSLQHAILAQRLKTNINIITYNCHATLFPQTVLPQDSFDSCSTLQVIFTSAAEINTHKQENPSPACCSLSCALLG